MRRLDGRRRDQTTPGRWHAALARGSSARLAGAAGYEVLGDPALGGLTPIAVGGAVAPCRLTPRVAAGTPLNQGSGASTRRYRHTWRVLTNRWVARNGPLDGGARR